MHHFEVNIDALFMLKTSPNDILWVCPRHVFFIESPSLLYHINDVYQDSQHESQVTNSVLLGVWRDAKPNRCRRLHHFLFKWLN